MAGILDSKERVIDFIITPNGRSQISSGRLKIEFASLSDTQTFYRSASLDRVADDASDRVYFETNSSPSDTISPELEAGTFLKGFRAGEFEVQGQKFALNSLNENSGQETSTILSGSKIIDNSVKLTENIINNFTSLRILGTEDLFSDTSEFDIGYATGSFVITQRDLEINQGKGIYLKDMSPRDYNTESPANAEPDGAVTLENSPSIFSDPRFDHLPNYRYLPPVNLPDPGKDPEVMGLYPRLDNNKDPGNSNSIFQNLETRQKIELEFNEISRSRNLMCQVFEFTKSHMGGVEKLSAVDNGIYEDPDTGELSHIFYIGKLKRDQNGSDTFLNIFTLRFSGLGD
jgi:hypothetical protein